MSPLLKEALKREQAFREIESRKPQYELSEEMQWGIDHEPQIRDFTDDDLKVNWLDGLGVAFVFGLLVVALNFI